MGNLKYIDIAKGIGILLVVLGHQPINDEIIRFIYSFHMGFFFILYGFLYKPKIISVNLFLRKKAKLLIGTYIIAAIWSVLFFIAITLTKLGAVNVLDVSVKIMHYIFGSAANGNLTPNGPLWFLLAYFFYIVYFQCVYYLKNIVGKFSHIIFLPLLIVLIYLLPYLPFSINASILAVPFFYIGRAYSNLLKYNKVNSISVYLVAIISILLFSLIFNLKNNYDISVNELGFYWDFILLGCFMFLPILLLSLCIQNTWLGTCLEFLGKRTLPVLCYHIPFIVCVSFLLSKLFDIEYVLLREAPIYVLVVVAVYPIFIAYALSNNILKRFVYM